MNKLFAVLAGAALLASPLAASAQGHFGGDHGPAGHAPAPAQAGRGFAPANQGFAPTNHGFAPANRGFAPQAAANRGFAGERNFAPAFRGGYQQDFRARGFAPGFRPRWLVGAYLPALYWDAYLNDYYDYGLAPAPYGYHWVDADGEALLIQDGTGAVVEVAPL